MPTNWPPATAPSWPPPGFRQLEASDWTTLVTILQDIDLTGWSVQTPTTAENQAYFTGLRCDHGHSQISGRIIQGPDGTRYPFAYCRQAGHRSLLVLWPPYEIGPGSAD